MPKISAATLEEHRAVTTDRILDAWGELIQEKGYSEASLSDLASRAGLVRTALYNYFPDREALLLAWTEREVQRTLHEIRDAQAGAETAADKLRTTIRIQLQTFAAAHLPPGREVAHFLGRDTYSRFMDHVGPVEQAVRDVVEEGIANGEFHVSSAEDVTALIQGCIGSERIPLSRGEHDVDEATDRVTAFVLRALGAQVKPARAKPRAAARRKSG